MPTCICGKKCKTTTGFNLHSRNCQKYKENILAGGTGQPPIPDNVDIARDNLKSGILNKSIETLQDCLNGVPMKECRIRAAIAVIKLTGADRPKTTKPAEVIVNFGNHDENEFEVDEEVTDDNKSESDSGPTSSIAV